MNIQNFAKSIAEGISKTSPNSKFGLVTFSTEVRRFGQLSDRATFDRNVGNAEYTGGYTNTQDAIWVRIMVVIVVCTCTKILQLTVFRRDAHRRFLRAVPPER